jgi:hypothetical protein
VVRTARLSAVASMAVAAFASAVPAHAANPFDELSGSWSGRGRAYFANGESEALRCSANYRSLASGSQLRLAIRCASTATSVDLRASLAYAGGSVSGTWEERTFNMGGAVSGSAGANNLRLAFSGGIGGTMSVALAKSGHQVQIQSSGSNLTRVTMSLGR